MGHRTQYPIAQLFERLTRSQDVILVGIAGPPAAGKSFAARALSEAFQRAAVSCAVVPMDGFHMSNRQLDLLGIRDRKGAPDTFDVDGLLVLLERLRRVHSRPIFAPDYDRSLHEPVAARERIDSATRLVIVEGNYLLLDAPGWREVGAQLDMTWFVDTSPAEREKRLVDRQIVGGRSFAEARDWFERVDGPNAALVMSTRDRADAIVDSSAFEVELREALEPIAATERLD